MYLPHTQKIIIAIAFSLFAAFSACTGGKTQAAAESDDDGFDRASRFIGDFKADSAYAHIANQVAIGPRVPGTPSHEECAQYIVETLTRYAADSLIVQKGEVRAHTGEILPITNILARYNPDQPRRVLLLAHWDTRPWADNERSPELRGKPIPGANDGASGVSVLLEIARNFQMRNPEVGVDLLFVDAEDFGSSEAFDGDPDSWCLGTQYWIEHLPYGEDTPRPAYAVLLDMVGGKNARFHQELFSQHYAQNITNKIWAEAASLGYGDVFLTKSGAAVTDDHVFLNQAGIPAVDIIESINEHTGSFPPTWHTHSDDLDNIDLKSLDAVGRTVLNIIYKEKTT